MRLPSKSATFAILMAASALSAFVLPAGWTKGVRGLFQAVILVQWPVSWATRAASQAAGGVGREEIPQARARELLTENEKLRREIGNQRLRLEELGRALEDAAGLRAQLPDTYATIIPAPVLAYDSNPRRQTLQILLSEEVRGRVQEGQWVAAGAPRSETGREPLIRQWLIGRVSEVQTRLARVQLATDPRSRVAVRTARVLADGTWQLSAEKCLLQGAGVGRMLLSQAPEDYFATGYRVVVVPVSRELPISLSLGRIVGSKQRGDSSQHFDVDVVPWQRAETLTHVYVLSMVP
jgi:cell shape-determining protein MreC